IVGLRLGRCLQKFHAHRRWWEVLVAAELNRLIAFGYDVTMPCGFHEALLCLRRVPGTSSVDGCIGARASLADSLHFAAGPSTHGVVAPYMEVVCPWCPNRLPITVQNNADTAAGMNRAGIIASASFTSSTSNSRKESSLRLHVRPSAGPSCLPSLRSP